MKDLLSTLLTSQNIIDLLKERIEKEDNPGRKKDYMRLLKSSLSAQSSLIDSLIIQLNLEKADISEMERELTLTLNND